MLNFEEKADKQQPFQGVKEDEVQNTVDDVDSIFWIDE